MIRGVICVSYGIFPAMKTTLPYSPMLRANASPNPARAAGRISGRTIRRNMQNLLAPLLLLPPHTVNPAFQVRAE